MRNTKDENTRIKEEIKTAWEEGDVYRLLAAGIDSFLDRILGNCPISFQRFWSIPVIRLTNLSGR